MWPRNLLLMLGYFSIILPPCGHTSRKVCVFLDWCTPIVHTLGCLPLHLLLPNWTVVVFRDPPLLYQTWAMGNPALWVQKLILIGLRVVSVPWPGVGSEMGTTQFRHIKQERNSAGGLVNKKKFHFQSKMGNTSRGSIRRAHEWAKRGSSLISLDTTGSGYDTSSLKMKTTLGMAERLRRNLDPWWKCWPINQPILESDVFGDIFYYMS